MHRRPLVRLGLAAATLVVLGCEAGDAPDQEDAGTAAPSEAAADFAPVNRSGITGTVEADHEADDVTVTVELAGLAPGTEYPVHIHTGRCAAGGPVAVPLGRITARPDSTGRLTTRADGSGLGDEPAFVQVHGPGGDAVACADLAGHAGGTRPLTDRLPADSVPAGDGGGE